MRPLCFALFAISMLLLVTGFQCVKCEEAYCGEPLAFRFVSNTDGSDVFANGTYDITDFHVLTMWADSTMAVQQFFVWDTNTGAKEIHFDLFEYAGPVTAYVFQFSNQEQDTLQVSYFKEEEECCGEMPNFMFGVYRGDTVLTGQDGIIYLKK